MRILVVHDRAEAREEVVRVCESAAPGAIIAVATDYVSGKRELGGELFDVAVVDLTLPHRSGRDEPTYEKAAALLQELIELDDLHTPGDIIGITSDPAALTMVNVEVGPHLMTVISEMTNVDWRSLLADRLVYIQRARQARQRSIAQHYDVDVCILTALDKERQPFRSLLALDSEPAVPGAERFIFTDRDHVQRRGVLLSIGRAGQPRAAAQAQILLNIFRPRYLLMSGICGGVKDKVKIGDVVIFESSIDWDYGKWKTPKASPAKFHSRPEPLSIRDQVSHGALREFVLRGDEELAQIHARVKAAHAFAKRPPGLHMGPCASGSAVVGSQEIIERIGGVNDAIIGVDMESYGLYAAKAVTNVVKPQVLCVKAVSDYCDGSKNDRWHAPCCLLSAEVVKLLMTEWLPFCPTQPQGRLRPSGDTSP
ncbi:MAG: hypothetical protein EON90_11760 [Brevundimonas sp.]|nr:MAG: hypothetical protein EON90_11760 [Brevundimonas sp.]